MVGLKPGGERAVEMLRVPIGLQVDFSHRLVDAIAQHIAADVWLITLAAIDRQQHAKVAVESDRQPAVPEEIVPVAWAPGFVAVTGSVHNRVAPAIHRDVTLRSHVLLGVAAEHRMFGIELNWLAVQRHYLTTVHGRDAFKGQFNQRRAFGVVLECRTRVRHIVRVLHDQQLTLVADVQAPERLKHLEAHATGFHRAVVGDLRAAIHEAHITAGQVDAARHLGVALIGPVANAHPGANTFAAVKSVEVHALVVI